jgi:NAD(P)H-dependent FMN reductase
MDPIVAAGLELGSRIILSGLSQRGREPELIDAKEIGPPILDRRYKEYPKGGAPAALEILAEKIRRADGSIFVAGEYNWGPQPGLNNLTDRFLEEWYRRPAVAS